MQGSFTWHLAVPGPHVRAPPPQTWPTYMHPPRCAQQHATGAQMSDLSMAVLMEPGCLVLIG